MYFLRLVLLKPAVMQRAHEAWDDFQVPPTYTQLPDHR